jgi:hypothetical protein
MREIRPSGSVRGVRSNPYPYRDPILPVQSTALFGTLAGTRISGLPQLHLGRSATLTRNALQPRFTN